MYYLNTLRLTSDILDFKTVLYITDEFCITWVIRILTQMSGLYLS